MKSDAQTNSRQYFLYLGAFYVMMGIFGVWMLIADGHTFSKTGDLMGPFCLIKGIPLFVCGLKFKDWIDRCPNRLRSVTGFSLTLSVLAFGSAMWNSGNGTVFTGDLFLAGLGQQFLEVAIKEKAIPQEKA